MKGKLINQMSFPATVFEKMNGYLGMVSVYKDDFYVSSKSVVDNPQANWLRELFLKSMPKQKLEEVKEYLVQNKATLIFEVIKPKEDPHIIDYPEDKIVLLNIVKNQIDFETFEWNEVENFAENFGLELPRIYKVLYSWEEFKAFYVEEQKENPFDFEKEHVEGYVIKCENNFMVKLKLPYYSFWKSIRGGVERELLNIAREVPSKLKEGTVEYDLIHLALDMINDGYNFTVTDFVKKQEVRELVKGRQYTSVY